MGTEFDKEKFEVFEALVTKGKLEHTADVGGITVGYRTLAHDEEVNALSRAYGQPFAIKVEQLTYAITSLNGKKIGDSDEEREYLRKLLGKMNSQYINEYYEPYIQLVKKVPPLTKENLEVPLEKGHQVDHFTTS